MGGFRPPLPTLRTDWLGNYFFFAAVRLTAFFLRGAAFFAAFLGAAFFTAFFFAGAAFLRAFFAAATVFPL